MVLGASVIRMHLNFKKMYNFTPDSDVTLSNLIQICHCLLVYYSCWVLAIAVILLILCILMSKKLCQILFIARFLINFWNSLWAIIIALTVYQII